MRRSARPAQRRMVEHMSDHGLTRAELLKAAAVATPALILGGSARPAAAATPRPPAVAGMNLVIILTDQERAIQHFPRGWAAKNLPGLTRIKRNGLSFERAFTNACMCSPARTTLMTGYLPAQHGVKNTLESSMPAPQYPQTELDTGFANIATVLSAAGYEVVYKGKFHCNKPAAGGENWVPEDVNQYGFTRWDPPDAGANQLVSQAGGGTTNHDGRFMNDRGDAAAGREGALEYVNGVASKQRPFALIVSLVNPHDVLFYPNQYTGAGYDDSWLKGSVRLPQTIGEDLASKPTAQKDFLAITQLLGKLDTPEKQRNYLNYYANLMRSSDGYVVKLLDALSKRKLLDDTLVIRTADHGEMGLAHGGLRQKNFNFYEESIRVPLIYSNRRLWSKAHRSQALVSHVDLLPTLATLFEAPAHARKDWQGVDYSKRVLGKGGKLPQDHTVFTYDDYQSGQPYGPYPAPPNHIVAIREARYKLAKYYDAAGSAPPQWECYDLKNDPLERVNIAAEDHPRTPEQKRQLTRLRSKLADVERKRLQPL
ncbi:MAG: sulfatase [Solirubrobacterales bacterium]|nr:sulfatase [Solirubrobacterales bacterium]